MRSVAPLTFLALATIAGACASAGSSGGSSSSSDVITHEQLQENADLNAYEVVRRLRPQWLRVRGGQSGMDGGTFDSPMNAPSGVLVTPRVIQDGVRVADDTTYLERISASQLRQIRFLDSRQATTRYGTGYPHGAIEILTTR